MTEEIGSHSARRTRRMPTPELPSNEEVGEHPILGLSQYRSWCPHCVVGRGVGQRHVASEEESGALPMITMDYGQMNGVGLGADSEASQATGTVDDDNFPILEQAVDDAVG